MNKIFDRYMCCWDEYQLVVVITEKISSFPLKGTAGYIDWWLHGKISRLILDQKFSGDFSEALLFMTESNEKPQNFLFIGAGENSDLGKERIETVFGKLPEYIDRLKTPKVLVAASEVIAHHIKDKKIHIDQTVKVFPLDIN